MNFAGERIAFALGVPWSGPEFKFQGLAPFIIAIDAQILSDPRGRADAVRGNTGVLRNQIDHFPHFIDAIPLPGLRYRSTSAFITNALSSHILPSRKRHTSQ